ncbi:MAG: dual specificity protein phosphatase [Ktedonobacteraceae bacterium]
MLSDTNVTPPPADTPIDVPALKRQEAHFSPARWFFTGLVRFSYRYWTRIAVRLFPEESRAEHLAHKLHLPLPDQLNMSWVTEQLAVGGRVHPEDIPALAQSGVTHVIDTRSEYCDDTEVMAREHIELLYLPTKDTHPLTVADLQKGAQWANEHIQQGGRVLIHCEHGVGRSVLLTCAVLVYAGMNSHEALQLTQQKRWQAAPNGRQVQRLREFETAMLAQA